MHTCKQSSPRTLPSHIGRPDYSESGIPESERVAKRSSLIKQLSPEEIKEMRIACRVRQLCSAHYPPPPPKKILGSKII